MTTEEAKVFLSDFIKRYKNQDNRCTAFPIYIKLQSAEMVPVHENSDYDELKYYHPEFSDGSYFDSKSDLIKYLKENDYTEKQIKENLLSLEEVPLKKVWVDRNIFFTIDGYNEHLRLNKHNYGEDWNFL